MAITEISYHPHWGEFQNIDNLMVMKIIADELNDYRELIIITYQRMIGRSIYYWIIPMVFAPTMICDCCCLCLFRYLKTKMLVHFLFLAVGFDLPFIIWYGSRWCIGQLAALTVIVVDCWCSGCRIASFWSPLITRSPGLLLCVFPFHVDRILYNWYVTWIVLQ